MPGAQIWRGAGVSSWVVPTAQLLGIGWFFATAIVAGVVLGQWIDGLTNLEPLFTLLGVLLGLAVALVGGYRMLIPFLDRFGDG
jgi:Putative F0F1-ATPase subunit Ca2+/Mg2+ transporter